MRPDRAQAQLRTVAYAVVMVVLRRDDAGNQGATALLGATCVTRLSGPESPSPGPTYGLLSTMRHDSEGRGPARLVECGCDLRRPPNR